MKFNKSHCTRCLLYKITLTKADIINKNVKAGDMMIYLALGAKMSVRKGMSDELFKQVMLAPRKWRSSLPNGKCAPNYTPVTN